MALPQHRRDQPIGTRGDRERRHAAASPVDWSWLGQPGLINPVIRFGRISAGSPELDRSQAIGVDRLSCRISTPD